MLKKGYLFLIIIIVCLFAISTVSAEGINNETNIANSYDSYLMSDSLSEHNVYLSDEEIQGSADNGTFSDLQKMINDAGEGSIISLEKNYIYDEGFSSDGITINKVLTINGNGYTIDALGKSGIFNANSALTLDNIVFKNGKLTGAWYGGGAINTDGSLIITNSIFKDNSAYYGGAIYSSKNVSVKNCTFINNKAEGSGVQQCKGGAIHSNSKVEVDNSTFIGNYAHDYGGAIYADTVHTNSKSYFINNVAADNDGGAIYTQSVYIVETVFDGNSACRSGGAIFNTNGITAKNSTFRNNKAEGASVLQCYGGAIYVEKLDVMVIVDNCTFIANHAADYGGAITGFASFSVSSSIFIDNSAGDNCGGAIYAKKSGVIGVSDEIKIVNSIFEGNHAYDDGGAIYTTSTNVNVKNSTFKNNYAEGASVSQCHGGAIASETNADYGGNCILKIDNSTFIGNHAYDYGGAIYADIITWVNTPSYFINNYVNDNQGGAIYTNKFNTDVSNAVFIGNEAKANDDGGAIYINKENHVTFTKCAFKDNKCGDEGGAIYLDSSKSHLTLKNNYFIGNKAGDEGQVVFNCGYYDKITDNWWGDKLPTKNNDLLIEWKAIKSNNHHVDSNPVYLKLKLIENVCNVGSSVWAQACFYHYNDGSLCNGEMNTDLISFLPTENCIFYNRVDNEFYVNTLVSPQKSGSHTITANLLGQSFSAVLTAQDSSLFTSSKNEKLGNGSYNNVNTAVENTNAEDDINNNHSPQYDSSTYYTSEVTANNYPVSSEDNKLTLGRLNQIFNKDFRNGHLLVYIDGKLVFNDTTSDNLLQIISNLLGLLAGNHEITVEFTDNDRNTNTYTENITI